MEMVSFEKPSLHVYLISNIDNLIFNLFNLTYALLTRFTSFKSICALLTLKLDIISFIYLGVYKDTELMLFILLISVIILFNHFGERIK
jgi:uncharacterized membrane protein